MCGWPSCRKTPGRTQHINFFELANGCFLADLPGYGYAQVPEPVRAHWVKLLGSYLQTRRQIAGLLLIMDARPPAQTARLADARLFRRHWQAGTHLIIES